MPYLKGPENPFSRPPLATSMEKEMGASGNLIPPPPPPPPPPSPSPLSAYRSPGARKIIGQGPNAPPTFPTGGRRRTRRRHPKKRTRKNKKKHF